MLTQALQQSFSYLREILTTLTGAAILAAGAVLAVRTRAFHLRHLGEILRRTLGAAVRQGRGGKGRKNLTAFQAACAAVGGTVGTGNIAGVTAAVFLGGPGAVFWMWVSALLGMGTKLTEIVLAVRYRSVRDGKSSGGPMYYMEKGLGRAFRPLAWIYAAGGGLACFGIGNLVQSNEVAGAAEALLHVPRPLTAGLLALIVGTVLLGGAKGVGALAEKLVPVMAAFYLLCGGAAMLFHPRLLPLFAGKVLTGAFGWQAAGGGFCGAALAAALRQGLTRGVFSNEAGLGSGALIHGSAGGEPMEQGLWGVFEVFADTLVCTVTAFVAVSSGVADTPGGLGAFASPGDAAAVAFDALLPLPAGGTVVRISAALFAFTSILGWCVCGEACWLWLGKGGRKTAAVYRLVFTLALIPGALGGAARLWALSDVLNALMALPNLLALLLLSGQAAAIVQSAGTFDAKPARKRRNL